MRFLSADYIFPISSPPLKKGVVVVGENGVVVDLLKEGSSIANEVVEHHNGIIIPGFVNAHCHIELSYLKGKITPAKGLPEFISELIAKRGSVPDDEIQQAIIDAEDEMRQGGMVAVGDISNTYHSFHQKKKRILQYHTFIEVFDIHAAKTKTVFDLAMKLKSELPSLKHSISPHAPYTVTPELMKKINDERQEVISIHNQETESEDELFVAGKGKLYDILLKSGADVLSMKTGERSLKRTLHQFKQTKRLLLVHNTFTNPQDVREAKELYSDYRNTLFFCLCPHANLYIENRLPDVSLLAKEGLTICVGTDSYASNNSLSIVEELKTLHHSFPAIDLETLLTWATLNGAKALGLENKFGSIEVGKSPGLVLVKGKEIQHLKLTHDTLAERMV